MKNKQISFRLCSIVKILLCLIMLQGFCLGEGVMAFKLKSKAFKNGGEIPTKYTCQGQDISPPLEWSGAPEGTKSFALIVDDPDAPDPAHPRMTWVHWILFNIPSYVNSLPEGVTPNELPPTVRFGLNDWHRPEYGGPCPPIGRHRYFFKLYALDTYLEDLEFPTKAQLEQAMNGHILGQAVLIGTYQKK